MRSFFSLLVLIGLASAMPAIAQVYPTPGEQTPRIQTVAWAPGQSVVLTALPQTALTVMLEPGERIERVTLSGSRSWEVDVSAETDSFQIVPQLNAAPASLRVETDLRRYDFALEVGESLLSAYLVRFEFEPPAHMMLSEGEPEAAATPIDNLTWSYRLRGDRSVRPASIRDNGSKTVIEYAPGQALPAVFAIGPSGDEEVVDGHMRDGKYVIDRVHQELVFRIDKEKARAKRNKREDGE